MIVIFLVLIPVRCRRETFRETADFSVESRLQSLRLCLYGGATAILSAYVPADNRSVTLAINASSSSDGA